jgi:hypothetical protein
MIAVIVRYKLADSLSKEEVRRFYQEASPKYSAMPGLIRKYFLIAEQAQQAGSVYLWETREHAYAFHNEAWREFIQGKYGHRPRVSFYECPTVIDNVLGEIYQSKSQDFLDHDQPEQ